MSDCVVCWTTCPNEKEAENLARGLIEQKLCACVNITPGITSVYWWDGKVNQDKEFLLMAKSTKENQEKIISFITQNHSYDTPEVIFVDISHGSDDYLNFIRDSLKRGS